MGAWGRQPRVGWMKESLLPTRRRASQSRRPHSQKHKPALHRLKARLLLSGSRTSVPHWLTKTGPVHKHFHEPTSRLVSRYHVGTYTQKMGARRTSRALINWVQSKEEFKSRPCALLPRTDQSPQTLGEEMQGFWGKTAPRREAPLTGSTGVRGGRGGCGGGARHLCTTHTPGPWGDGSPW